MDVRGSKVLILGGSGLVGRVIARRLLDRGPSGLVIGALREDELADALEELHGRAEAADCELTGEWGDVFHRIDHRGRNRAELMASAAGRTELLEDLFGEPDAESFRRSMLYDLLVRHRPEIVIDCINTATAIAYQDEFASAAGLRAELNGGGGVAPENIETHLGTLYLPQLIRHAQVLVQGMRRAGVRAYLKIGTSGTGGMGLNIPFTHSEERPSRMLLAKASVAGAHSLLLFLMARTPDGPAVKEIKPTAAIAWKRIAYGPVLRGGRPIPRVDAASALPLERAFGPAAAEEAVDTGESIESVFLDAGENGLFSLGEFETISSLGMMEVVTPEEIADATIGEIEGRPTGRDIVAALDASTFGPTYRGGALRESAMRCMEELEREHGVRSVAFEMLGPPRLSKLLFEAYILERLYGSMEEAAQLDEEDAARRAQCLVEDDAMLRSDMLSVGIPILLADGERILRGRHVKVEPEDGDLEKADVARLANGGWVDLRPASWVRWRERCARLVAETGRDPGPREGSAGHLDPRARSGEIRPGALAAFIFRGEDGGARVKR